MSQAPDVVKNLAKDLLLIGNSLLFEPLEQITSDNYSLVMETYKPDTLIYADSVEKTGTRNIYGLILSSELDSKKQYLDQKFPYSGLWIINLFILPSHQNKGRGTEMLNTFLARNQGKNIYVKSTNELAKKLFNKCGFKTIDDEIMGWRKSD